VQLSTYLGWVRTSLDASQSPLRTCFGHLRCREGGGLERATTSLLLRSPQIQSLDQLLNQLVIGNHFLYSQSIMVINCCGFTTGFESRGAHGPEEQWHTRDTRVYISLCLREDKNPTSYVRRCIMIHWGETPYPSFYRLRG
jgi:hypothetical protein